MALRYIPELLVQRARARKAARHDADAAAEAAALEAEMERRVEHRLAVQAVLSQRIDGSNTGYDPLRGLPYGC